MITAQMITISRAVSSRVSVGLFILSSLIFFIILSIIFVLCAIFFALCSVIRRLLSREIYAGMSRARRSDCRPYHWDL